MGSTLPDSGANVVIGDPANQKEISMQVLQHVYNELTGKNEKLKRTYELPFQIDISNLESLNQRLTQALEQYKVVQTVCSIKVFFLDDRSIEFSSFEKFKFQVGAMSSPVENLIYKLNFLIVLPEVNKPQSYEITVKLNSMLCTAEKIRRESFRFPFPKSLLGLFFSQTASVSIEHVDFIVAKTLLVVVEDWFNTVSCCKKTQLYNFIRKYTHLIPNLCKFLLGGYVSWLVYNKLSEISLKSFDLIDLAKFQLLSLLIIFSFFKLGEFLGELAEKFLDNLEGASFIRLTAADTKLIEGLKITNKHLLIKVIASISLSVVSALISTFLINFML